MAALKGEAAVAAESSSPAAAEGAEADAASPRPSRAEHDGEELPQATLTEQRDGEGEQRAAVAAEDPPSEESLAQLRTLGRQLLQGWAEALTALGKLPGVGSMRVEVLAVRLQQLAREVSPAAAAAAASAGTSEGAAAAAAASSSAAAAGGDAPSPATESVGSRGGTPPPTSELAGPSSQQRQAYSDPVDMFATAAKSAHLSYPELLHAFAASAEGASLHGMCERVAVVAAVSSRDWLAGSLRAAAAALPSQLLPAPATAHLRLDVPPSLANASNPACLLCRPRR
jgi:hypothetical protein